MKTVQSNDVTSPNQVENVCRTYVVHPIRQTGFTLKENGPFTYNKHIEFDQSIYRCAQDS